MRGWRHSFAAAVVLCTLCPATAWAAGAGARAAATQPAIFAVAGTGKICRNPPSCGDGSLARSASLTSPEGVAFDRYRSLFIADRTDDEVRMVRAGTDQTIIRFAGNGLPCSAPPACGDGGPANQAYLSSPSAVAIDPRGGVMVADTQDAEVRWISPNGSIYRVAGNGRVCAGAPNCGDGGPAIDAQLNLPQGVAVDPAGNVYIADGGDNEIRKVSLGGIITRVAGNGGLCLAPPDCGDGGRATNAALAFPGGVAVDRSGNVFIADAGDNEIRQVSPKGIIRRIAGTGLPCVSAPRCGDGGRATNASLNFPDDAVWAPDGSVYVADRFDQEIRRISGGKISRLAGQGRRCQTPPACGDRGPALSARLNSPQGVAVDPAGNVWLGDSGNNQVRMVAPARSFWISERTRALSQYRKLGCKSPLLAQAACSDAGFAVLAAQAKLGRVRCFGRGAQPSQAACQIARPLVTVASNAAKAAMAYFDRYCPRKLIPQAKCAQLRGIYEYLGKLAKKVLRTYS